jgi:hypothetical protein
VFVVVRSHFGSSFCLHAARLVIPPPPPCRGMDDPVWLLLKLHGDLLRCLSARSGRHHQGLAQACRGGLLPPTTARRLRELDIVSGWLRHVTAPRCADLLHEVLAAIGPGPDGSGAPPLVGAAHGLAGPPFAIHLDSDDELTLDVAEGNFCPSVGAHDGVREPTSPPAEHFGFSGESAVGCESASGDVDLGVYEVADCDDEVIAIIEAIDEEGPEAGIGISSLLTGPSWPATALPLGHHVALHGAVRREPLHDESLFGGDDCKPSLAAGDEGFVPGAIRIAGLIDVMRSPTQAATAAPTTGHHVALRGGDCGELVVGDLRLFRGRWVGCNVALLVGGIRHPVGLAISVDSAKLKAHAAAAASADEGAGGPLGVAALVLSAELQVGEEAEAREMGKEKEQVVAPSVIHPPVSRVARAGAPLAKVTGGTKAGGAINAGSKFQAAGLSYADKAKAGSAKAAARAKLQLVVEKAVAEKQRQYWAHTGWW